MQIDLITGFLGAGKTTFLRYYASYLLRTGLHIGIVVNDLGAVNIDRMLLQELENEQCEVEQVVGGNTPEDWKRRFKTKLIALAMRGVQRVVVEPSGIYDIDSFFDVVYDEPINTLCSVGSILTIVDAQTEPPLPSQAEYLLVTQAARCGQLLLSKVQYATPAQIQTTLHYVSDVLHRYDCPRDLTPYTLTKDWAQLTEQDYAMLAQCGHTDTAYRELRPNERAGFTPLFIMNPHLAQNAVRPCIEALFNATDIGAVYRVKGFFKAQDGSWQEVNATKNHYAQQAVPNGQDVIIIIGEALQKSAVEAHFAAWSVPKPNTTAQV